MGDFIERKSEIIIIIAVVIVSSSSSSLIPLEKNKNIMIALLRRKQTQISISHFPSSPFNIYPRQWSRWERWLRVNESGRIKRLLYEALTAHCHQTAGKGNKVKPFLVLLPGFSSLPRLGGMRRECRSPFSLPSQEGHKETLDGGESSVPGISPLGKAWCDEDTKGEKH